MDKIILINKENKNKYKKSLIKYIDKYEKYKNEYFCDYEELNEIFDLITNNECYLYLDQEVIKGYVVVYDTNCYKYTLEGFKQVELSYFKAEIGNVLMKYIVSKHSNLVYCGYENIVKKYLTHQIINVDYLGISQESIYLDKHENYANDLIIKKYNDHIEKNLIDFNLDKIVFEVITAEQLHREIKERDYLGFNIEWDLESNAFVDFHFFGPVTLPYYQKDNTKYLVAKHKDLIVGVIKYTTYDYIEDIKFQCVDFIDIHSAYKNKGIATKLIKEFNNCLDTKLPLINTSFTEEGKLCNLNRIFTKEITCTKYFENEDKLTEYYKDKNKEYCI